MKTIAIIITYIITNIIVIQSVFDSEKHVKSNNSIQFYSDDSSLSYLIDYQPSQELVNIITEFVKN